MNLSYSKKDLKRCIDLFKDYKGWGCYTKDIIYFTKSCSMCKCMHDDPNGDCLLDWYYLLT